MHAVISVSAAASSLGAKSRALRSSIASEKINYRRFFDVTDLIGVRVENPEVFEARNRRTLELIAEGKITGLRIDHIDGLYEPIGHMKKLQMRIGGTRQQATGDRSQEKSLLSPVTCCL